MAGGLVAGGRLGCQGPMAARPLVHFSRGRLARTAIVPDGSFLLWYKPEEWSPLNCLRFKDVRFSNQEPLKDRTMNIDLARRVEQIAEKLTNLRDSL
jgi:hypothetical protein